MKKKRILTIAGIAAFFVAVITVIIVLLNVGRTSGDSSETGIRLQEDMFISPQMQQHLTDFKRQ